MRNMEDFDEFFKRCDELIELRDLSTDPNDIRKPRFQHRNIWFQNSFHLKFSGHIQQADLDIPDASDCVLLAYDAMLGANGSWNELCLRSILNQRHNVKTGAIAGAWFGAYNGFKNIPEINYFGNYILDENK